MKRISFLMVCLFVIMLSVGFAEKKVNRPTLVNSVENETIFKFDVNSYSFQKVKGLTGNAVDLKAPFGSPMLKKGAPEILKFSTALIIPEGAIMKVQVSDKVFTDIQNIDLAPSKGVLNRTVDPTRVPFTYGAEYNKNAFFPGKLAELGNTYHIRDNRGQAVIIYPFQYNPVTKVLRVYTQMTVKVYNAGISDTGQISSKNAARYDGEFRNVFSRHFLNYQPSLEYTPLNDGFGRMLVIAPASYISALSTFHDWKESCGYTVDIVDYATIGSATALKTYVANYYNTNGLTYLLLVGDHAQVPTSSTTAGDSDNNYGYITSGDKYLDIFVGRFSAETTAQLQTQLDRTLWYERDLASAATYFRRAIGCGTSEGPGHNNEYDYQHVNNMLTDCSNYGYSTYTNHQSGGTTAALSSLINTGAGIILYCGHGYDTGWSCGWTFSNTNVAALTNTEKLPFIFNVSCVTGNFKNQTCFSEAWMRSTYNNLPIGAIAIDGSTINQDWVPPMDAQDEMVDIMVAQGKRTFGGVTVNGMFKMQDIDGTSGQNMADTWVCFGDPSLQLRTPGTPNGPTGSTNNPPVANFIGSPVSGTVPLTVNFTDLSSNTPTSWSWNFGDGGTSTLQNPSHQYTATGTYTVTLTATNAYGSDGETKTSYITVNTLQAPVAAFTASATTIVKNSSVTFTDQSTNSPTSWSWTFNGGTPSTSTAQNPTVTYSTAGTYSVTLTATNAAGSNTLTKTNYITVTEASYCASASTNCTYEWIGTVKIGSMTNTSSASNYTDFTSKVVNMTRGTSVSFTLTPKFSGSSYTEYWKLWIDYNKDGDFADTGEQVYAGSGKTAKTSSFTVPSTASTGATRIRVSMKYSATPSYCETFTYGEVEDYTANIQ